MAAENWQQHVLQQLPRMEANATAFEPGPANPQPFSTGIALTPQFDPLEILPARAQDRLRLLRQRAADAHAIVPAGFDIQDASATKIEAANALKRLVDHPQDFGFGLKLDDPRVVAAQRTLDKMTADFTRLQELQTVRTAAWQSASAALANAEAWLKGGRPGNTTLEDAKEVEPQSNKGEDVLSAVERLRRRGRELRADLHRIRSAPFPSSYAKAQMRAQIEALAQQGQPSVSALIELDGKVVFAIERLRSEVYGEQRQVAFAEVPDVLALTCYLNKDALIAALDREIDSEGDDKAALSHEARQKAEAEVQGDLLEVERQEAELTGQAQAQGLPIEHRADISPLALLAVRLVTTPRGEAAGTTPGLSWDLRR